MAKATTKGQTTIPKAIRQIPGVGAGDKVLFYDLGDGSVAMKSARLSALRDQGSWYAACVRSRATFPWAVLAMLDRRDGGQRSASSIEGDGA